MEWDEVRLLASGFRSRCLSAGPVKALRHSPTQTRTMAHVLLCPRLRIRQLTRDERQKASQENKSLKCGLPPKRRSGFLHVIRAVFGFSWASSRGSAWWLTAGTLREGEGGETSANMLSSFSARVSVSVLGLLTGPKHTQVEYLLMILFKIFCVVRLHNSFWP